MLYLLFFLAALAQMTCDRADTAVLMCSSAVQFAVYFYILYKKEAIDTRKMLFFAVFIRFFAVFAIPNLSDDIYRFLWDGTLWHEGLHPLVATPTQILVAHDTPIFRALYPLLNSPDYFTVYPSVCQGAFWFATAVAKGCTSDVHTYIYVSAVSLKMLLVFAECGTLFLLYKMLPMLGLSPNKTLIYALNPLVIHEICGNAHCEGFMIFFLAAALGVWILARTSTNKMFENKKTILSALGVWALARTSTDNTHKNSKIILSALFFSLAVCSKLLPLLFLPLIFALIFRLQTIKKALIAFFLWSTWAVFFSLILFVPLYNADFVAHFGASLNLYFQKFEYNASIYYLLRACGIWLKGYNWIAVVGPAVAALGFIGILGIATSVAINTKNSTTAHLGIATSVAINTKNHPATHFGIATSVAINKSLFFQYALFSITIYLLCTTILHPWYIVLPIFLSCFTNLKYPIAWSALIFMTYINYSHTPFYESTWILWVEYGILAAITALDFKINKKKCTLNIFYIQK